MTVQLGDGGDYGGGNRAAGGSSSASSYSRKNTKRHGHGRSPDRAVRSRWVVLSSRQDVGRDRWDISLQVPGT